MLRFFDCPECNQPCFTSHNDVLETGVTCECGCHFEVSADARPFEMAGIEPEQA